MIWPLKLESLPQRWSRKTRISAKIESYVATFVSCDRYIHDHDLNWMDFG
jgi:hypothetical protein